MFTASPSYSSPSVVVSHAVRDPGCNEECRGGGCLRGRWSIHRMEHDVVACAFVSLALCDSSGDFLIGIVRVGDRDPERGREAHGQESTLTCSGLL